jgi:hypothetical protein
MQSFVKVEACHPPDQSYKTLIWNRPEGLIRTAVAEEEEELRNLRCHYGTMCGSQYLTLSRFKVKRLQDQRLFRPKWPFIWVVSEYGVDRWGR